MAPSDRKPLPGNKEPGSPPSSSDAKEGNALPTGARVSDKLGDDRATSGRRARPPVNLGDDRSVSSSRASAKATRQPVAQPADGRQAPQPAASRGVRSPATTAEVTSPGEKPSAFALPKPPPGYRPDDQPDTTSTDAIAVASSPLPADAPRDGNTAIKDISDVAPARMLAVFPLPKPPAGYKPDVANLKTNVHELQRESEEVGAPAAPSASAVDDDRARDGNTVIKDVGEVVAASKKAFEAPKPPAAFKPDEANPTNVLPVATELSEVKDETQLKDLSPDAPGAYSRAQAATEPPRDAAAPAQKVPLNRAQRTALGVIGGCLAVLFLYVAFGTTAFRSIPDRNDLRRFYPYGLDGIMTNAGQRAPGFAELEFKLEESVSCDTHVTCVRYRYTKGEFTGAMVLGKRKDKIWEKVSDEMPFRLPPR